MVEFNWLHLTDLHWGMRGFEDRWDNVEQDFLDDLKNLINRAELGSLDLVLFTGDLVYSGGSDEFEAVDRQLMQRLWDKFDEMGFEPPPKLLAVPGNHDLRRQVSNKEALLNLVHLWNHPDDDTRVSIRESFWYDYAESATRKVVEEAFANYANWWQGTDLKPEIHSGVLPGDFAATIEKEGYKLGIVGLNSAFLQLVEGYQKGKLVLANRQFNRACDGGSGQRWIQEHDLCLLLTHHPPDWLTEESQTELDGEIYQPGRFALHLFGHMHNSEYWSVAIGGDTSRRRLQGCSLFAMDGWGRGNENGRMHGYSLGQLRIEDGKAHMRIWPRKALKRDAVWRIDADNHNFTLPDDRGTDRITVKEGIAPRSKPPEGNRSYPGNVRQRPQRDKSLKGTPGKVVFNWLHLTDLHLGIDDSRGLWSDLQDTFFDDLKHLLVDKEILQGGPLDLVLFTGDLVYSGRSDQFERVNGVLERLREELEQMGHEPPKLLAIPGNHDLLRPPKSTEEYQNRELDTLIHLWDSTDCTHYQRAFWIKRDSPQRKVVDEAFKNYSEWWRDPPLPKPDVCRAGELPGDFSATITKEGEGGEVRLGIVGLNSAFLQLVDGDRKGKLALDRGQFNSACGGNGSRWVREHNTCLLLTHHPPGWLTGEAAQLLRGLIHRRAGRFALHLFGHMHDAPLTRSARDGRDTRNYLQGRSLFGSKEWEWGKESETGREARKRSHGYSIGQLEINHGDNAELRVWPRKATEAERDWEMNVDQTFPGIGDAESATMPVSISRELLPQLPESSPNDDPDPSEESLDDPEKFQRDDINLRIDPILILRLDALQRGLCRSLVWIAADFKTLEVKHRTREELEGTNVAREVRRQLTALDDVYERLCWVNRHDDQTIIEIWHDYAKINVESRNIFGEYLDPIGGLSIRDETPNKKISDMQDVADEFVRACARDFTSTAWLDFLAAPARQDAFNKAIARIFRLRFPQWTIWGLPLVAKAFGHMVIEQHHNDLADFVRAQVENWSCEPDDVYEILADTFATYMIGPAYVCAAIILRLDPSAASGEGRLTDADRAEAMFAVLEHRMTNRRTNRASDAVASEQSDTDISGMIDLLRQEWQNVRGRASSSEGGQPRELDNLARDTLRVLRPLLKHDGRYLESSADLANVMIWARDWLTQLEQPCDGKQRLRPPKLSRRSTLRDVLNVAWLCRLQSAPGEISVIADAAYELCKDIIKRRRDPPVHPPEGVDPFDSSPTQ